MQRTTSLENNPSWTRHLLRGLFLVMAFILPASIVFLRMSARPSDPHPSTQIKVQLNSLLLEPPAYDPNKPTVVVVMGNGGTEMTDFIQPYVVFAESKKFNVYAVGASRSPATMIGDIKVIPHFSFAEFDRLRIQPDLIVVPYITPRYAAPVIQWIRKTANDQTRFLSVCAGAQVLAATGLLKNHSATTHQSYFQRLRDAYPDTQWIEGVRYVDSDRIVTTGGVTAGVDGALHLLDKLTDRHTAEEIARKVGYPNLQFLDSPEYHNFVLTPAREVSFYAAGANYLFLKNKQQLGIFLYDGVNEIGMAGVMDTYYVSAAYENVTVSAKPQVVRTEHNLFVVAQYDVEHAPRLARLIVPDGRNQPFDPPQGWAYGNQGIKAEYPKTSTKDGSPVYPFDAAIQDIAWRQGQLVAFNVAREIEYPTENLRLWGARLPPILWIPLAAGSLGLIVAVTVDQLGARRRCRSRAEKQVPTNQSLGEMK